MNIFIHSIQDLLHAEHLSNSFKHAIIFITTKPNYYSFGYTPFLKLDIPDVENPNISIYIKDCLEDFLDRVKDIDILYVCCDAGLSRSPAVAMFAAEHYGNEKQSMDIETNHRFINMSLYHEFKKDANK